MEAADLRYKSANVLPAAPVSWRLTPTPTEQEKIDARRIKR